MKRRKELHDVIKLSRAAKAYLRDMEFHDDKLKVFDEALTHDDIEDTILKFAIEYGQAKGWDKDNISALYKDYTTTIKYIANI